MRLIEEAKQNITEVNVQKVADEISQEQDIIIIDVRESAEYSQGHLPDAINFPRGVLEVKLHTHPDFKDEESPLDEMNKKSIYLYCQSGGRSALATESLLRMGFNHVYSMAGGFDAWKKASQKIQN